MMISLVQYESSDESDDNTSENTIGNLKEDKPELPKPSLFTNLPQPKCRTNEIIEEDNVITTGQVSSSKKNPKPIKKQPVKISIPSLSNFPQEEDDIEPTAKKSKAAKGSGLFSILPLPKATPLTAKSFIPNVLTTKRKLPKPTSTAKLKAAAAAATESDDEFTELPETFDDATWQKVCGRKKKPIKPVATDLSTTVLLQQKPIELAPEPEKTEDMLDNKAFKELVGSSKKPVNVKLIDINEEEILSEKDTWMTKSLTDPECEPKYEVTDPVNNTCKKKHHITYLVQQAKANEQDLKNQWAANRFSRKQTQAKYGF